MQRFRAAVRDLDSVALRDQIADHEAFVAIGDSCARGAEGAARAIELGAPVLARARTVPATTAVASVTAPALPDAPFGPGSAPALDDGASPDADYVVKGKTATRVFYAPGSAYYARTRADVWFRTPDDASAAGFTPRAPRRSN